MPQPVATLQRAHAIADSLGVAGLARAALSSDAHAGIDEQVDVSLPAPRKALFGRSLADEASSSMRGRSTQYSESGATPSTVFILTPSPSQ